MAFWATVPETESWKLYLATPVSGLTQLGEVYGSVYDSLARLAESQDAEPGDWMAQISLLQASDPFAQAAVGIRDQHAGVLPIRISSGRLGPLEIEQAVIYPPVGKMTPEDIFRAITQLMNRRGRVSHSQVTLADQTKLRALPVGLKIESDGEVRVTLFDVDQKQRREVGLGEIDSIL